MAHPNHSTTATSTAPADLRVLFIDRAEDARHAAQRALYGWCTVQTAASSHEALTALKHEGAPFTVVVTGLDLPDLEGDLMLRWVGELYPDVGRVLLVHNEPAALIATTLNEVGAAAVLPTPLSADDLRSAVRRAHAARTAELRHHEAVEGTLRASVEAMASVLAIARPAVAGRASRVRRGAERLARKVGLTCMWDVEMAALLSQVGMLVLDAQSVERLGRNEPVPLHLVEEERSALESTLHHLETLPRMQRVCQILRGIDLAPPTAGSREPSTGDAERVLTLALEFDGFYSQLGSASDALDAMRHVGTRYHAPYFHALEELVGPANPATIVEMPLASVQVGHVFASDVHTANDLMLVARGQAVTPGLLQRIQTAWSGMAPSITVRVIVCTSGAASSNASTAAASAESPTSGRLHTRAA